MLETSFTSPVCVPIVRCISIFCKSDQGVSSIGYTTVSFSFEEFVLPWIVFLFWVPDVGALLMSISGYILQT